MVRFRSNFQIIFNCTSSIEVTALAPLSLIWTMLQSPFNESKIKKNPVSSTKFQAEAQWHLKGMVQLQIASATMEESSTNTVMMKEPSNEATR